MVAKYILDGKKVMPFVGSDDEWQAWKDTNTTIVGQTQIDNVYIVTNFGGLDCRAAEREGPPLVFITGVIDMQPHPYRYPRHYGRYATWQEAETGHAAAVAMVKHDLEAVELQS